MGIQGEQEFAEKYIYAYWLLQIITPEIFSTLTDPRPSSTVSWLLHLCTVLTQNSEQSDQLRSTRALPQFPAVLYARLTAKWFCLQEHALGSHITDLHLNPAFNGVYLKRSGDQIQR